MHATLEDIKSISLHGFQHVWKIKCRGGDVVLCEGDEYVRISPANPGLVALVLENNETAPADATELRSITCSVGLTSLLKLRSQALAKLSLDSESSQSSQQCTLFSDNPAATPQPKAKKPRLRLYDKNEERTSLEVEIMVSGQSYMLKLLKPKTPQDSIFAFYEPSNMGLLIQFIREQGFSEDAKPRARTGTAISIPSDTGRRMGPGDTRGAATSTMLLLSKQIPLISRMQMMPKKSKLKMQKQSLVAPAQGLRKTIART